MSLINDALKRARQHQKNPPSGGPPLTPVEPEKPGSASEWILPTVIVFLIVAACFFIGLALAKRTVSKIVAAPEPATAQQVEAVPIPPVMPAPTNIEPEIPAPAPPKVQGIVYDPVRPWAIVDGRTVFIGDRVREFRVKEIAKNTITLETTNGSQKKLGLGQ
jgi:hypothetical protein